MSSKNKYVNQDIYDYLKENSSSEDAFLKNLRTTAKKIKSLTLQYRPNRVLSFSFTLKP
jgi:hypothetical protein